MNYTELENPLSSQSEVERGERTTNHRLGGRALDRVDGAWLWLSLSLLELAKRCSFASQGAEGRHHMEWQGHQRPI